MSLTVVRPGLLTTIQDLGRTGYQKYGVIVGGGMDSYSLRLANLLVGNEEGEAALEITLTGPMLKIEGDVLMAITGGDLSPTVAGEPVPMGRPVYLKQGTVLQFGACRTGCRSYLAVAGGYTVPEVMGSKSTYLRAGIGGFRGRPLQPGDMLATNPTPAASVRFMKRLAGKAPHTALAATSWYAGRGHIPLAQPATVRAMRGGQYENFTPDSREQFWHSIFQVTPKSDRMGYRLTGPGLHLAEPLEMISEAVSLGTIQVPPDGNPILLMADRQTTGGYPKIAQVALADVPLVAQMKPGGKIRFQEISLLEAERLYIKREHSMQMIRTAIRRQWESCL
ncbi:allophanate hydrolase subunit 2 [Lucifera butyrica]|uniref:Allophanate hydrolase subunit 2 n=1 Tax=Lucifera butyrica TaxID=1351585 RepID=A0A498RFL5_9FIRM|nr:biotin-dependent carboxyltransferase family protein [Lucifera butyrica]VBB09805.1 allophanate hydrolase subunit 2 [Lucifera butyrica]